MKNTGKTAKIAILLLVLCMISTAMLGGTFAKYTSEYAGKDTALIAKWKIVPKGGQTEDGSSFELGTTAAPVTLDLFTHAYDKYILGTDGTDPIIAPGVKGKFVLNIANEGDVAAKITFNLTKSGNSGDVPIEYSFSEDDDADYYDLAGIQDALNDLPKMQKVDETTGTATQTVYWRWPYEASKTVYRDSTNATDTALGKASAKAASRTTYILTVKATAEQIGPEE